MVRVSPGHGMFLRTLSRFSNTLLLQMLQHFCHPFLLLHYACLFSADCSLSLFLFSSLPPFISSWVALVFRQDQSLAQHTLNATNAMLAHAVRGSQMHRMIFVRTRMTHGWTSLFAYVPWQLGGLGCWVCHTGFSQSEPFRGALFLWSFCFRVVSGGRSMLSICSAFLDKQSWGPACQLGKH